MAVSAQVTLTPVEAEKAVRDFRQAHSRLRRSHVRMSSVRTVVWATPRTDDMRTMIDDLVANGAPQPVMIDDIVRELLASKFDQLSRSMLAASSATRELGRQFHSGGLIGPRGYRLHGE